MTDDRSLERAARSWLEVGPTQAPARAVEAALLHIETTPQERDWHVPWRLPTMTTPARVATAAVIGVLAIGGAFFVLRPMARRRRRARSVADADSDCIADADSDCIAVGQRAGGLPRQSAAGRYVHGGAVRGGN